MTKIHADLHRVALNFHERHMSGARIVWLERVWVPLRIFLLSGAQRSSENERRLQFCCWAVLSEALRISLSLQWSVSDRVTLFKLRIKTKILMPTLPLNCVEIIGTLTLASWKFECKSLKVGPAAAEFAKRCGVVFDDFSTVLRSFLWFWHGAQKYCTRKH